MGKNDKNRFIGDLIATGQLSGKQIINLFIQRYPNSPKKTKITPEESAKGIISDFKNPTDYYTHYYDVIAVEENNKLKFVKLTDEQRVIRDAQREKNKLRDKQRSNTTQSEPIVESVNIQYERTNGVSVSEQGIFTNLTEQTIFTLLEIDQKLKTQPWQLQHPYIDLWTSKVKISNRLDFNRNLHDCIQTSILYHHYPSIVDIT